MERSREHIHPHQMPRHHTPPCICQPIHSGCDPELCEKAVEPPLKSWVKDNGPAETLFLYARAEEWAEGASQGCMTCAVVSKIAGKNVRPEERVAVQRKAGECSIFGQHVFKDRDNRKPGSVTFCVHVADSKAAKTSSCNAFPPASFPDSESTSSDTAFQTCKAWLRRCIKSHELCRSKQLYRYPLPRRLIYIGVASSKVLEASDD